MPAVKMIGHDYAFPISDVLRLFYGDCTKTDDAVILAGTDHEITIFSSLSGNIVSTWIDGDEESRCLPDISDNLPPKREIKRQLYLLLSLLTGHSFPWGSLTGIRPTVVAREVKNAEELTHKYFVRPDKAALSMETAAFEDKILDAVQNDALCAYIGVPFCLSRCSYCSFISQDAAEQLHLLSPYTDAVQTEIDTYINKTIPRFSCLYVGGGTPTVFDDDTFRTFLGRAFGSLRSERIHEITVEAGRPDTITAHKLHTLKDLGVHRICINPQTLSDKTLVEIGRKHTADDFFRAYYEARDIGFTTINTDLIAGLPGETEDDFFRSLETILLLQPENITIHTLSRKRTASIAQNIPHIDLKKEAELDLLIGYAHARLHEKGYAPYYLYRQKDTVGGHENTGYTKPGHECRYNVAMMSDQRSILAFGAGSVSKRAFSKTRLERCPCVRDVHEYMRRAEEMAGRKLSFFGV